MADLVIADAEGLGDAESLAGLPCGLARAVESVGVAVAECCVCGRMGRLAHHRTGKARGGVAGDVLIEGEVATASFGAGGEHREGGGFAGTGSRLQDKVVSCLEGVGGLDLLFGRGGHNGSSRGNGGGFVAWRAAVTAEENARCAEQQLVRGVLDQKPFQMGCQAASSILLVPGDGNSHGLTQEVPGSLTAGSRSPTDDGASLVAEGEVHQDAALLVRVVGGDRADGEVLAVRAQESSHATESEVGCGRCCWPGPQRETHDAVHRRWRGRSG